MTETQKTNTICAVKNVTDEAIIIYRAKLLNSGTYEISAERYFDDNLIEASCVDSSIPDFDTIEKLLINMCKGTLEPCHLKDIIADLKN